MRNFENLSNHQKDQLLDTLFYYMSQDTRALLMRELPQAYNAAVGREVVTVRYTEEGRGDVREPVRKSGLVTR